MTTETELVVERIWTWFVVVERAFREDERFTQRGYVARYVL